MKPGARTRPAASTVFSPVRGARSPIAAMCVPSMRTLARRDGEPVPSMTVAFVIRTLAFVLTGLGVDGFAHATVATRQDVRTRLTIELRCGTRRGLMVEPNTRCNCNYGNCNC